MAPLKKIRILVFFFVLALSGIFLLAQDRGNLEVFGRLEENNKIISGGTIRILENGSLIASTSSNFRGRFNFMLEVGKEYIVEFSAPDMVTKRLRFDTRIPQGATRQNFFEFDFVMDLFPFVDGIDFGHFDQPLASIEFVRAENKFSFSEQAAAPRLARANAIRNEVYDLIQRRQRYAEVILRADNQFNTRSYETARVLYVEASGYLPNEVHPKNRIQAIDQILAGAKEAEENYRRIITQADNAFSGRNYDSARTSYREALNLKPLEGYPRQRLEEIERILARQQEQEKRYREMIAQADNAFNRTDYAPARTIYQEASVLKPEEAYPKQKIQEISDILSRQQDLQNRYNGLIARADQAFQTNDLSGARPLYQQALDLKPNEQHPKLRIEEIDRRLANLQQTEDQYRRLIEQADRAFENTQWADARAAYVRALELKARERHPAERIQQIDRMMAEQADRDRRYQETIRRADQEFGMRNLLAAKALYEQALSLKSGEGHPSGRIAEINRLLSDQAELDRRYNELIRNADNAFTARSYAAAREAYVQAGGFKPNENYPRQRITAIDDILAKEKVDRDYTQAIGLADAAYQQNDFAKALGHYREASGIKPAEAYPRSRITELTNLLAQTQQLNDRYDAAVAEGDRLFNQRTYPAARNAYARAVEVKPDQEYPRNRIREIDQILAQQDADTRYFQAIEIADRAFAGNDYTAARGAYIRASEIKSAEEYPRNRIAEIDRILQTQAANQRRYNELIAQADAAFNRKDYPVALVAYRQALELISDAYPRRRIEEIEGLLANQSRLDEQYRTILAVADQHFRARDWNPAQDSYQRALELKPGEVYPRQQITEIERLRNQQAVDGRYEQLVSDANRAFDARNYNQARPLYVQAQELKTQEAHPRSRINEIDEILRRIQTTERAYAENIQKGDAAFQQNDLNGARSFYVTASGLKPSESYPRNKIGEIDRLLEQTQGLRRQYNGLISQGDKAFEEQVLGQARGFYLQASQLFAQEPYPQQQIARIDQILADRDRIDKAYQEAITQADRSFASRVYPRAKEFYEQALGLKPGESYPRSRIQEIDRILGVAQQEEAAYQAVIREADQLFSQNQYIGAKDVYFRASRLRPNDPYPRNRIAEIDRILAESFGSAQAYNNAIAEGDRFFNQKQYYASRNAYQQALAMRPGQSYPENRIREINEIIARSQDMDEFYRRGSMEVSGVREVVKNNEEKRYQFVPFERRRRGSYVVVTAENLSGRNIQLFVNYGQNQNRVGGFALTLGPRPGVQELRIEISGQSRWITDNNDWIGLLPVGGDLEIHAVRIVFGN